MRAAIVLLALVACARPEAAPDAGLRDSAPPVSRAPDAGSGPSLEALEAKAAVTNDGEDWRRYADALAHAGRRPEAAAAYEKCAERAGDSFELSLYCQAAKAVAKQVKKAK